MTIGDIEKHLLAVCSLDQLGACDTALNTLVQHLPDQLSRELNLHSLQISVNCTITKHKTLMDKKTF